MVSAGRSCLWLLRESCRSCLAPCTAGSQGNNKALLVADRGAAYEGKPRLMSSSPFQTSPHASPPAPPLLTATFFGQLPPQNGGDSQHAIVDTHLPDPTCE